MIVVIAVDDSEAAGPVLDNAAQWLGASDAEAEVLTVMAPNEFIFLGSSVEPKVSGRTAEASEDGPQQALERAYQSRTAVLDQLANVHLRGMRWKTHVEWSAATGPAILDRAAALHADAIVMGTHGRRGVARVLLGSVAQAVVHESRIPVLLVGPNARTAEKSSKSVG